MPCWDHTQMQPAFSAGCLRVVLPFLPRRFAAVLQAGHGWLLPLRGVPPQTPPRRFAPSPDSSAGCLRVVPPFPPRRFATVPQGTLRPPLRSRPVPPGRRIAPPSRHGAAAPSLRSTLPSLPFHPHLPIPLCYPNYLTHLTHLFGHDAQAKVVGSALRKRIRTFSGVLCGFKNRCPRWCSEEGVLARAGVDNEPKSARCPH